MKKFLIKFVCLFLFKREWRTALKDKFCDSLAKVDLIKLEEEINTNFHPILIEKQENSAKFLHFSTYKVKCGIATFFDEYINGLMDAGQYHHSVVSVNLEYNKDPLLFKAYLDKIIEQAEGFDVFSIQHEYTFWKCENIQKHLTELVDIYSYDKSYYLGNLGGLVFLDYLISKLFEKGKKVNIVWHTSFEAVLKEISKNKRINIKEVESLPFFRFLKNPLITIITMNKGFVASLQNYGISTQRVCYLQHPVPQIYNNLSDKSSLSVRAKYDLEKNDIVLASFGFLNKLKGVENVLSALKYLPINYKFIYMGGIGLSDSDSYLKKIEKFIEKNGLKKRAFITGFLAEEELASYMKEVDIGLYVGKMKNNYASGAINYFILNKVPTITSNIANFKAMEKEFGCIKVIENPNNHKEFAKLIQNINSNTELKSTLKSNCDRFANENTFGLFAKKNLDLIFDDNIKEN